MAKDMRGGSGVPVHRDTKSIESCGPGPQGPGSKPVKISN